MLAAALIAAALSGGVAPPPAIATPINAGSNAGGSGASTTLTANTLVDIPAGSVLRVMAWNGGSNMPASVSDTVGSTYTAGWSYNNGTYQGKEFYVFASSLIPSGTPVTVDFGASANGYKIMTMVLLSGISAYDYAGTGATGTGTVATKTTNAFAQANTLILADDLWGGGNADGFTFGSGFAQVASHTSGVRIAHTSYKIVAATTAETITVTETVQPFVWSLGYSAWKGN